MYTSMMVFGNKPAKMVDDMHQTFYMLPLVFICLALVGVLFCAAIPLGYLWQKRSDQSYSCVAFCHGAGAKHLKYACYALNCQYISVSSWILRSRSAQLSIGSIRSCC